MLNILLCFGILFTLNSCALLDILKNPLVEEVAEEIIEEIIEDVTKDAKNG